MTSDRRWEHTLHQHEAAVESFVAAVAQVPADGWYTAPAPDKWSPATLTLHVTDAYEMGLRGSRVEPACNSAFPGGKPGFIVRPCCPS